MALTNPSFYAPPDFKPHWVDGLDDETYHADKTCVGSSQIRLVLDSPKAFHWGFFKGYQKEVTKEMKLGTVIHTALLEGAKFREKYIVCPDFGDMRSSKNRDKRADWQIGLPRGAIVVSPEELDMIVGIVDAIMEHPDGQYLFKNGRPEVSGYYRDPETGIKAKVRLDFLSFNSLVFIDLKSAKTSQRAKFGSDAFTRRVDIQLGMYRQGIRHISGVKPDVSALLVVEKQWPFEVAIYYFEESDFVQADIDLQRGFRRLHKCMQENHWPMRQTKIERVHTPGWFMYQMNDENEGMEYD